MSHEHALMNRVLWIVLNEQGAVEQSGEDEPNQDAGGGTSGADEADHWPDGDDSEG